MEYKDLNTILEDLNKELIVESPQLTTLLLVADHVSGEFRYYVSGFLEVQASALKVLLDKEKALAVHFFLTPFATEKGS